MAQNYMFYLQLHGDSVKERVGFIGSAESASSAHSSEDESCSLIRYFRAHDTVLAAHVSKSIYILLFLRKDLAFFQTTMLARLSLRGVQNVMKS